MNPRTISKTRLLLFAAATFLASQVFAVSTSRYTGPDWTLLDPHQVLQAAATVTQAKYPNCDEVTVDEKTMEVYHADGTAECQDETYTKVLTEKGRRENTVITMGFLLPYYTVQVPRLEIIKPDGTVVPVNVAANAKVSIDNSQMAENIYDPDSRILTVNVPGLRVGDMVHSVTRYTVVRPIIPKAFSDEFLFEGDAYIRHISCEIRGPASDPLRHVELRDRVGHTVTATTHPGPNGTTVYRWEVNDVPRMYNEPSMPPYIMVLQRLLVSTLPNWQAVSRWYWKLSLPHLEATSPAMRRMVDRLIKGASTDEAKAKAVFYYVSKKIRYMGVTPEKNRPGFEPHDVKLTFAKKYGVCRDKAALLVAMLRMAGIRAYPALINVGTRLDPDVPDPDFNHEIVAAELSPRHYQLMDPTDETTRVLLPAYDDHQSYLVCRPDGEGLALTPVTPPAKNMMRITTTGTLEADGTLTATSDLSFRGVNDDAYRNAFARMKPDDRRHFFESRLQQTMPGVRLTSLRITPEHILNEAEPLRARLSFTAPAMAAFGKRQAIVSLPWIGHNLGVVNFILGGTGLDRRKYPLETQVTAGIDEHISLKLAPVFARAVSIPSGSTVNDDCLSYRRRFSFADDRLDASKDLQLKVVEFSPKQYLELKQTLKNLDYDERKAPVIALSAPPPAAPVPTVDRRPEPPVASNARILVDQQKLTVTDAHAAVLRVHYVKKILTYAGKIRESEVKIPYNPATETARIIDAAVISASGQRQEISKDETNVMDAAWNSSAGRYTGGKILVDSLPGVEIGSTIEVEYEVTMKGVPFLSGFQSFQLPDALEQKSFEITAPPGVPIRRRESGPIGIIKRTWKHSGARNDYEWKASHVGALPEESNLPPMWTYQAGVSYYVGNPHAYFSKLDETMRARAAEAAHAGAEAQRLASAAKTKLGAVKAIRDFVATTVRLAGPPFTELPLRELSAADTTLSDGYGHHADRAILLYAMLKAAGFHPQFVLASDLPAVFRLEEIAQAFPLPNEFNFPLVRVAVGGETVYLNDTDQYAHLGSTAHDDRLGIVPATGACVTIHAAANAHDGVATTYSLSLDNDGDARIGIKREYYGMAYEMENRRFSELRPEERVHYFQEAVSNVAQGARPVGGLTTDFSGYPGVEQYTVDVSRYGVANDRCLYFSLPFTPHLLPARTDRRQLPMLIPGYRNDSIRTEIKLPPGYRDVVIRPRTGGYLEQNGVGHALIHSSHRNGTWVVTYDLKLRPEIIRPLDYPAVRQAESALENKAGRMLLLERNEPMPGKN